MRARSGVGQGPRGRAFGPGGWVGRGCPRPPLLRGRRVRMGESFSHPPRRVHPHSLGSSISQALGPMLGAAHWAAVMFPTLPVAARALWNPPPAKNKFPWWPRRRGGGGGGKFILRFSRIFFAHVRIISAQLLAFADHVIPPSLPRP